jgi:hypothetical protein
MDSAGYCRIRMESDREKSGKNEFGYIHFTTTFEFEYGYGYPYLCFSGYGYRIIRVLFPSLIVSMKPPLIQKSDRVIKVVQWDISSGFYPYYPKCECARERSVSAEMDQDHRGACDTCRRVVRRPGTVRPVLWNHAYVKIFSSVLYVVRESTALIMWWALESGDSPSV